MGIELGPLVGVYSRADDRVVLIVYRALAIGQPRTTPEAVEVRSFAPDEIPWEELAFWSTELALRELFAAPTVRALVPVNLRPAEKAWKLGNRFGLVFLDLPIGIENPVERLYAVRENMRVLKGSYQPVVALGVLAAMGQGDEHRRPRQDDGGTRGRLPPVQARARSGRE